MRKRLTAVVLAVLVFSLIAASAASLGGINQADLGADATIVASCDTDGVVVDYQLSFDFVTGQFDITDVDVSDIHANCNGDDIYVEIGASGASIDSGSGTVAAGAATVTMTAGTGDAEALDQIAIYISDVTP